MKRSSAQRINPCGALTVGLDLGDRSSRYCVLDEHGEVMQERTMATNKKSLDQVFGSMPRCRVALSLTGSRAAPALVLPSSIAASTTVLSSRCRSLSAGFDAGTHECTGRGAGAGHRSLGSR